MLLLTNRYECCCLQTSMNVVAYKQVYVLLLANRYECCCLQTGMSVVACKQV